MAINIRRFDPAKTEPYHAGKVPDSSVLPETMTAPFWHQYGCLKKRGAAMSGYVQKTDQIYIIISGSGYVVTDEKNCCVRAGDTVVIPAGQWHTLICTDKDEAPLIWAAFWWEKIADSDGSGKIDNSVIHIHRFEKEKAEKAHQDTILASAVVPPVIKTPFGHAYGYLENGNEMELHAHPTDEFYIVYSGSGLVIVGDEERAVNPGDVIEIPRNAMHSMRSNPKSENNGAFLWAAFWWNPIS